MFFCKIVIKELSEKIIKLVILGHRVKIREFPKKEISTDKLK